MGDFDNRRRRRKKKRKKRKRKNICSNKFSQDILVDFEVEFEVNILDIEIDDVTLI